MAVIDEVLGGLAPALPLALVGPSGSGRTLLCIELAYTFAQRGETVVLLTGEPAPLLLRQARSLELDLTPAVRDGRLVLLELVPDAGAKLRRHGAQALLEAIEGEAPRARVLLVDPLTALTGDLVDEGAQRVLIRTLFEESARAGRIIVVTAESERLESEPSLELALEGMCGALIELDQTPVGARQAIVRKSRSGARTQGAVEFEIEAGGTRVAPARPEAEDLPASRPAPRAPAEAPARAPRDKPTVLVVEDEAMTREMYCDWLGTRYEVVSAGDGFEAMSKVVSHPPDLVVLDLVLPRVSGFEVIRALRSAMGDIPILVVSGNLARSGDRVRVLVLGATDMLEKPVQRFELMQKADTLLRLPSAPRSFDGADVDRLLFNPSPSRLLDEAAFRDRLERAYRFGNDYGLSSTLVFVETPSAASLDSFLNVADTTLRLEDALLPVPKTRAVLLLVATEPEGAKHAVQRIGGRILREGGSLAGMRWRATPAAAPESPDWNEGFVQLAPWPKESGR